MWQRDHTDTIESIKKDIKRIRRAGSRAELFGWLLLLFAAGIIWIAQTKADIVILYAVFTVIGLFFIYTGKYVKDGRGRRTKLALLLNCIVAVPLCVGIIPIYVCIQSINNHARFKDLPENIRALYNAPKRLHVGLRDILVLLVVIIAGVISIGFKVRHLDAVKKTTNTTASAPAPVNTASKYGFTITFPGSVSETDFSEQQSGHTVTYSTYDSTADKGSQDFDVYAYSYPTPFFNYTAQPASAMVTTVHNSLISIIQGLNGTLVNSTPSTYLGHASEDAQFTCLSLGGTITGYIRVLYIGNYEYGIFAKGSSQDAFNSFANSFQYQGT
jgi:hypothetical protein